MTGILLSGGMDSISLAYWCKPDVAFNINYGQKAAIAEREASKAVCEDIDIPLVEIDIDCTSLGSGDLAGKSSIAAAPESDWWPYRNQLLITLCAMKAVDMGCSKILIGTVKSDQYHSDGSQGFIKRINELVSYQEGNIKIEAPAIELSAVELVRKSNIPLEILAWSHSCHKSNIPCSNCRGCNKHYQTMKALGHYND